MVKLHLRESGALVLVKSVAVHVCAHRTAVNMNFCRKLCFRLKLFHGSHVVWHTHLLCVWMSIGAGALGHIFSFPNVGVLIVPAPPIRFVSSSVTSSSHAWSHNFQDASGGGPLTVGQTSTVSHGSSTFGPVLQCRSLFLHLAA